MIPRSHRTRLITSALAIPVVAAATLAGGWPLFALVFVVSALGMREFFAMREPSAPPVQTLTLAVVGAAWSLPILAGYQDSDSVLVLGALVAAAWTEKALYLIRFGTRPQDGPPPAFPGTLAAGLLYVPCALGFFLRLSPTEIFFVLSAVAVSDAGAYYCGGLVGGPRLWPAVSPKKTWAGGLGGLVLCVGWCLLYGVLWGQPQGLSWAWLAVMLNVASQGGDFYESALKRVAGIKDSGGILPGHGGILDRIDGLLPAVLIYAFASRTSDFFL
jgi:phosphatidate cytidylyltransferase